MVSSDYKLRAVCDCGSCSVESKTLPKSRIRCHCTICQSFTGSAYSDVVLLPGFRAKISNPDLIQYKMFKKFRFPPPNLRRGRCAKCGKALVETWGSGPVKMLFVRSVCVEKPDLLPPVEADVFYEHHLFDADSQTPKFEGYYQSQYAIVTAIAHAF